MKSLLAATGLVLALSSAAFAAPEPAASGDHMMGHAMASPSAMKGGHMMGSMKKSHMKKGSMKSSHMMGHAMASPSAMKH